MRSLFFHLGIALLLLSGAVHAKDVVTEARNFVLRGESASYFILNLSDGQTYYVVQIDDKNSLVFDGSVNVVLKESLLAEVLKEYYKQSGASGFTDASKAQLLDEFNQSDLLFDKCHFQFYNLVETNFFWAQFKCVDSATGRICDAAFAQRKRWKDAWDAYKAAVGGLKTADTREGIVAALTQIEERAKAAKNETTAMDDRYVGYAYFLGATMDKEPACKFNYALVDDVIFLSSPAMRNKITDVNAEAKELISIYNWRKDILKVKELQNEGKIVLEKGINLTSIIRVKFAPLSAKQAELEAEYNKLRNASTPDAATVGLNNMNIKYKELQELISDPKGVLYSYNRTVYSVDNAKAGVENAKKKYGEGDSRVISLNNEYVEVVRQLEIIDQKLSNGTAVKAEELGPIERKADEIAARANGLQAKQNEIDIPTVAAIIVLVAAVIGGIVYFLKYRKKKGGGKELSIREVMGSGGDRRRPEREKVDSDQDRKAMFPKL